MFEVGRLLCLKKESYSEEIIAWVPGDGKVGSVVNDAKEMVKGTFSGMRIYDFFADTFYGKVMFTMGDKAIVKLIVEKKQNELKLYDMSGFREEKTRSPFDEFRAQ